MQLHQAHPEVPEQQDVWRQLFYFTDALCSKSMVYKQKEASQGQNPAPEVGEQRKQTLKGKIWQLVTFIFSFLKLFKKHN